MINSVVDRYITDWGKGFREKRRKLGGKKKSYSFFTLFKRNRKSERKRRKGKKTSSK